MEEFKNDLMDLFEKHGISALKSRTSIDVSPLIYNGFLYYADVTIKFSRAIVDKQERQKHCEEHGLIINNL